MENPLREEINQLHAHICNGLADPIRILLLYTLADRPHSVGELAEQLELPQSTVSRHLKILRERGLAIAKRQGQFVYYHLADSRVIQALDLLREVMADRLQNQASLAATIANHTQ